MKFVVYRDFFYKKIKNRDLSHYFYNGINLKIEINLFIRRIESLPIIAPTIKGKFHVVQIAI